MGNAIRLIKDLNLCHHGHFPTKITITALRIPLEWTYISNKQQNYKVNQNQIDFQLDHIERTFMIWSFHWNDHIYLLTGYFVNTCCTHTVFFKDLQNGGRMQLDQNILWRIRKLIGKSYWGHWQFWEWDNSLSIMFFLLQPYMIVKIRSTFQPNALINCAMCPVGQFRVQSQL